MMPSVFHALIRTHHITSRKKVATLKATAKRLNCHAMLRSGGVPGVMFVQGESQTDVQQWVDTVHGLRYKDYQLVSPVQESLSTAIEASKSDVGSLEEVSSVKEMAAHMEVRGLLEWWRIAMGFTKD